MAEINEKLMNGAGTAELWAIVKERLAALQAEANGGIAELRLDTEEKYGDINRHWWKYRAVTEGYVAVPKSVGAVSIAYGDTYCADSYTISEDGVFVLTNPVAAAQNDANARIGKYFINSGPSGSTLCYAPPNATRTTVTHAGPGGTYETQGITPVTTYACEWSTGYGEWMYVSADEREAFPDIGEADGLEYVYLGVPAENARETVKIQTGSYAGTGVYGKDSPNTITLDFAPKFLFCRCEKTTSSTISAFYPWAFWVTGAKMINSNNADCTVDVDGTTISWYSTAGAAGQLNAANTQTHWIAIG